MPVFEELQLFRDKVLGTLPASAIRAKYVQQEDRGLLNAWTNCIDWVLAQIPYNAVQATGSGVNTRLSTSPDVEQVCGLQQQGNEQAGGSSSSSSTTQGLHSMIQSVNGLNGNNGGAVN